MNYFELITELCYTDAVGEDPPVTFDDTDEEYIKIKQFLNLSNKNIIDGYSFNFKTQKTTISTVVGQREYDKPDGVIIGVYYNSQKLTFINDECLLNDTNGSPVSYYLTSDKIGIQNIPDNIYSITIKYETSSRTKALDGSLKDDLSLETDVSIIPIKYHDVIVLGAEVLYMRDKKNKNLATAISNYKSRLTDLLSFDKGTLDSNPVIIMP